MAGCIEHQFRTSNYFVSETPCSNVQGMNTGAPEGLAVPTPLVATVVLVTDQVISHQ